VLTHLSSKAGRVKALERNHLGLQVGMPAQLTNTKCPPPLCKRVWGFHVIDLSRLLDVVRHDRVEEVRQHLNSVCVLPLVVRVAVHRRKVANESLVIARRQTNLATQIACVNTPVFILKCFVPVTINRVSEEQVRVPAFLALTHHFRPQRQLIGF